MSQWLCYPHVLNIFMENLCFKSFAVMGKIKFQGVIIMILCYCIKGNVLPVWGETKTKAEAENYAPYKCQILNGHAAVKGLSFFILHQRQCYTCFNFL